MKGPDPLFILRMNPSFFLGVLAAAIGFFMLFRKFRFQQEIKEIDSSFASPSSISPSSSSHNWTHQVFPSFRGEDVRINFLSHIQKEFKRKGITPFIDNEIKRGESIGPKLKHAIRGSKIALVMLSKNYASSSWCLDELVEILKCKEELGQTLMPIFYKVDPSDVKKLTGKFGMAFKHSCSGKTNEVIRKWRRALAKVATTTGYCSNNWYVIPFDLNLSKTLYYVSMCKCVISSQDIDIFRMCTLTFHDCLIDLLILHLN